MRRLGMFLSLALGLSSVAVNEARADDPTQAPAKVDVVTLKDGRKLEGQIVAEDDRFVSISSGGTTRAYARDTIASIEKAPRPQAGQDGAAAAPQAGAPPAAPAGADGKKPKAERKETPLSDSAKAWLDALIAKSADGDESVRRSVAAAIGALGRPAAPVVRAAATAAPEGPQKQFLTRLADDLDSPRNRKMRGEGAGPDGQAPGPDASGRPGQPRRMLEGLMARLSTELELRDEQKPKVETVMQGVLTQRMQLFRTAQSEGLTAEQVTEKVTALRTDMLAQMKAVLDEPQYTLFQEMAARLVEPPKGPPPRPADGSSAPGAPAAPPPKDGPK